jgi:Asp-tRNA(Asn)/Glu-tRNA(Gln) amidotransferase A subunit family amidase
MIRVVQRHDSATFKHPSQLDQFLYHEVLLLPGRIKSDVYFSIAHWYHAEILFFSLDERDPTHIKHSLTMGQASSIPSRREFLTICGGIGIASSFFVGALYALAAASPSQPVTPEIIDQAAELAGITILPEQKEAMLSQLRDQRNSIARVRQVHLPNNLPPAFRFEPLLGLDCRFEGDFRMDRTVKAISPAPTIVNRAVPANLDELAYATVRELGELIRQKKVSSLALTEMYLARLKRFDPKLHFTITLTEERAKEQAKQADEEIANGNYRGPLHGIPWGAKDLLAVRGYPTTWGAGGFEAQSIDEDATVVKRLDEAGAVLIAKLTLGALAMGDKWFGGRTRNPWNLSQGSSGSSAGSAAATASGCAAFAIGSETLGSISSPSTRCGTTGYRPTFGFVPRTGAMALAWTMDKLGPICRAVEDCALVMQAIYGPDDSDLSVIPAPFAWDANFDWKQLRVAYVRADFDQLPEPEKQPEGLSDVEVKKWRDAQPDRDAAYERQVYDHQFDVAALEQVRRLGVDPRPVDLPDLPFDALVPLLIAEAAAAFDGLTLSGRDKLLTEQGPEDWPNQFRAARFYPAVDYIQANRVRTLAIREMKKIFSKYDVVLAKSSGSQLTVTNLTGHPSVILPNGLRKSDAPRPPSIDTGDDDSIGGPGTPVSITFLGRHYEDGKLLAFARAYQEATGFHQVHPPGF